MTQPKQFELSLELAKKADEGVSSPRREPVNLSAVRADKSRAALLDHLSRSGILSLIKGK